MLVEHWHNDPEGKQKLRPLNMQDLISAAESVRPGVTRAQEYGIANLRSSSSHFDHQPPFGSSGSNGGSNAAGMAQLMAAAAAAAAAQRGSSAGGAKSSGSAAAAADGAAAANGSPPDTADAVSDAASAQDEVYKMVGKMVLNSLSWQ